MINYFVQQSKVFVLSFLFLFIYFFGGAGGGVEWGCEGSCGQIFRITSWTRYKGCRKRGLNHKYIV